jgi:hypothetical protein
MDDNIPSQEMLDKTNRAASAPDPSEQFLADLRRRLENRAVEKQQTVARNRRIAWSVSMASILLVTAGVLLAGPQNVVSALRDALGYIPGFGVVRTTGLRMLAEPVTAVRDGVTITIQSVIADSMQTDVTFEISGLNLPAVDAETPPDPNGCIASPSLRFANGQELAATGGGGMSTATQYAGSSHFPPIPPEVGDVALFFPCIAGTLPGTAPEQWGVPFHIVLNSAAPTVFPIQIVDTPSPERGGTPTGAAAGNPFLRQISLRIDSMAEVDDGYIILGSVQTVSDEYLIDPFFPPGSIVITDSAGAVVPAEAASIGNDDLSMPENQSAPAKWAYKVQGKYFHGPLTLSLTWVTVSPKKEISFRVDVGSQPQDGQTWALNQPLALPNTSVELQSAKYVTDPMMDTEAMQGLEFTVRLPDEIEGLQLNYWNPNPEPGYHGGGATLSDGLRHGADTIRVGFLTTTPLSGAVGVTANVLYVNGPWTATWDPPLAAGAPSPTPVPQACLTNEIWDLLRGNPAPDFPPGLAGKLLLARGQGILEDLYLHPLDGSGEIALRKGTSGGMLSPDGARLAFDDADGKMFVQNLLSGETNLVAGDARILSVHWSPDGQWIGFSRQGGPSSETVYLMHPDGTGRRILAVAGEFPDLNGWFPDSRSVLISVSGASMTAGISLQRVDITTGAGSDILPGTWVVGGPVLSPDGTRVAYLTQEFGRSQPWLYVARLDGSERRLIAALDGDRYATSPQWSPDGKWLGFSVGELGAGDPVEMNVFLRPDTCGVYPLPQIQGRIESWAQ